MFDDEAGKLFLVGCLVVLVLSLIGYNLWHFWGAYQARDVYEMVWHGFWFVFWGGMGLVK